MANDKKVVRKTTPSYRLPERLPKGEVLQGILRDKWEIGDVIGSGGFGVIYLARSLDAQRNGLSNGRARTAKSKTTAKFDYVIKVDHVNGPLFAEMHFYLRVAKKPFIEKWLTDKGMKNIGIPEYISSGRHLPSRSLNSKSKNTEESEYRFLVMPRFGPDLQKILDSMGSKISLKVAYTIGMKVIDVLEYVHSFGYVHADVKASNLLLTADIADPISAVHDQIWLVDYGLADRYISNDKHKEYCEDKRKENNGTVEFLARDSHVGAFSRKSDLEILAYNILSWTSGGRLPWMSNLQDYTFVKESKLYYMDRLHELFNFAFLDASCDNSPKENKNTRNGTIKSAKKSSVKFNSNIDFNKLTSKVPEGLVDFFQAVIQLEFTETPNYEHLKEILRNAIQESGENYDGTFCFQPSTIFPRRNSKTPNRKRPSQPVVDQVDASLPNCITGNNELFDTPTNGKKLPRNGRVSSRLRKEPQEILTVDISDDSDSLNDNQLAVMESIRKKRNNVFVKEPDAILRSKRKHNIENQIEDTQPNKKCELDHPSPFKNGTPIPKSTRKLRSSSNQPSKQVNGTPNGHLNGKANQAKSASSSEESKQVYLNPTPAMSEILRKIREKNKIPH